MGKRILFTAADANYFTQAAVLVHSLSLTQFTDTHLLIFGNSWTHQQILDIKKSASNHVSVEVLPVNEVDFKEIKLSHGFPLATAYNLIASRYLLSDYDHAIYMDADIVVLDDLGGVWDQELTTPVSAVIDAHIGFVGFPSMWRPWRELGVDPKAPYLNTGLMNIDLKLWREQEITEKCLDLLASHEMPCIDQDALNLVLNGKFDHMHPRYNLMPYHLLTKLRTSIVLEAPGEISDAISSPAIIHYHRSFLGKPWVRGCSHPAMKLWKDLATQVDPKWKHGNDLTGFIKSVVARRAGMTALDPMSNSLREIKIG
jgi:lipopolysaccharide biosynthesis glycosyltransferase